MEEKTVAVRGGDFQTQVLEAGTGDPLLFLHGSTDLQPNPFLDALAARYRVVAPRHPGYGKSTGSEQLLDIHDLIYYYLDFLDAEGLRGLPLIGHSLGAMFAAELAAVQPDRFSKLVLIAPFGLWNPEYPVADFFAMTPRQLAPAMYYDAESPAAAAAAAVPSESDGYIHFMVERAKSMATAAKYLWPIPNRGLAKRLHRVSAPTLLVWGESDAVSPPRYARDFQAAIAGATVATIPNAAHMPQVEQPAALADVVLRFLGK